MKKKVTNKKIFLIVFIVIIALISVIFGSIISTIIQNQEMTNEEKIKAEKMKEEEAKNKQEELRIKQKEIEEREKEAKRKEIEERNAKIKRLIKLKEIQEKKIKNNKMKEFKDKLVYNQQDKKLFYFFIGYSNKKLLIIKEKEDVFIINFQDNDGFDFPLSMRETFKTDIKELNTRSNKDFDIFTAMFLSEKSKSSIFGEQYAKDLEIKRIGNAYITNKVDFTYKLNKFIYIPKTLGINGKPYLNLYDILKTVNRKKDIFMANFNYSEMIFLQERLKRIEKNTVKNNFYIIEIDSKRLNNIILAKKLLNNEFTIEEIQSNVLLNTLNRYYRKRLEQILEFYGKYNITKIESFVPYKEKDVFVSLSDEDNKKVEEINNKKNKLDLLLSRIMKVSF